MHKTPATMTFSYGYIGVLISNDVFIQIEGEIIIELV